MDNTAHHGTAGTRATCLTGLVIVMIACVCCRSWSGELDSSYSPTNPASAMFTIDDVYRKLDACGADVSKRSGGFTDPTGGPTNGTMHTLDDIMTMMTNRAPVMKTGQTISYHADDDGARQTGVASPNPRFTIEGDGSNVVDNLTGLMWSRNMNIAVGTVWSADGRVIWTNALEVIDNTSSGVVNRINYCGYDDWRLPSIREIESIMDYGQIPTLPAGHPFTNVVVSIYWSSTSSVNIPTFAWCMPMNNACVTRYNKTTSTYYVWPVRGGPQ